jgi:hypothetical protein
MGGLGFCGVGAQHARRGRRGFKWGGSSSIKWATRGGSAAGLAVVGVVGLSGSADSAINGNFAFAATQFNAAGVGGTGIPGLRLTFNTKTAVNMSFLVNGQSFGHGAFTVPSVVGPDIVIPSSANASSAFDSGTLTNAISISVDVASGPVRSVFAPTNAVVNLNHCNGCNALAADYTFVVSPGTAAGLTASQLASLYAIAGQINTAAHVNEPSQELGNTILGGLASIASVLNGVTTPAVAPAAVPANSPLAVAPAAVPAPAPVQVQRFGTTHLTNS